MQLLFFSANQSVHYKITLIKMLYHRMKSLRYVYIYKTLKGHSI